MYTYELNGTWQAVFTEPQEGDRLELFKYPLAAESWMDAQVPGDIHADLLKAGKIENPYTADNLEKCRWTQEKDLWYRYDFEVSDDLLRTRVQELVFDGLDTVCEVWFNRKFLGKCKNMFRQYRFDVTDIADTKNTVTVKFFAQELLKSPLRSQREYECTQDRSRVYFRKTQSQGGWDWAPNFGSLGIWQNVRVLGHDGLYIEHVKVETKTNGEILVRTELNRVIRNGSVRFHVKGHGTDLKFERGITGVKTFASFLLENPQIWWPNGHGTQPIYECTVEVVHNGKCHHQKTVNFGIREVTTVEKHVANDQLSWHIIVNGKEIFCTGANWVPPDIFPGALPPERLKSLLRRVKEAGFNMLRIWGSGMYMQDLFYDLCDELGIMVWHDFAFGNADYPVDKKEWRSNVICEIDYQVKRLQNHPSIVLWCGGNERSTTFIQYEREPLTNDNDLFGIVLPGLLNVLDTTRPYVTSSPVSYLDMAKDPSSGNQHSSAWLYAFLRGQDVEAFRDILNPAPPFNSEFFHMGAPRAESFRKVVSEKHLWPPDDVWIFKFRGAPEWNQGKMISFYEYQLISITKFFEKAKNLSDFLKFSSVAQMETGREEFEFDRCMRKRCGGALFWMMNDTWPCATWAIVDFFGVPKPVFYSLKRSCRLLHCTMTVASEKEYGAFVCNDTEKTIKGELEITYQTTNGEVIQAKTIAFEAAPNSSKECFRIARSKWTNPNALVYLKIKGIDSDNFYYPSLWKKLKLSDPGVSLELSDVKKEGKGYTASVTLKAKKFARCVYIDLNPLNECVWEDNFFDMLGASQKKIKVWCPRKFEKKDLKVGHWLTEWDS